MGKNKDNDELELLHGEWDNFKQMMVSSGAEIINQWQEHVHASLSRLILLASIAPQD